MINVTCFGMCLKRFLSDAGPSRRPERTDQLESHVPQTLALLRVRQIGVIRKYGHETGGQRRERGSTEGDSDPSTIFCNGWRRRDRCAREVWSSRWILAG